MSRRVTVDGSEVEVPAGATVLEAAQAAGERGCRRSASTSARTPFGACRVCLVGVAGSAGEAHGRDPGLHHPLPRWHGDRHRRPAGPARRDRGRRARALRAARARPPPHTELADVAARLERRRAALARRGPPGPRHDERHPYLAFQHELCISCGRCVRACDEVQGDLRADRDRPGFRGEHRRRARPGLPRLGLRLVRRLRRHLSRPTRSPSSRCSIDADDGG